MIDMRATIIPKSDQINFDDLIGGSMDITITGVKLGSADQPVNISYEGEDKKVWRPCKSMRRVLITVWGHDGENYIGKTVRLYGDEKVKWAGGEVGGIRISHMSDMDKPLNIMLTETRGKRKPYKVEPLVIAPKNALTDKEFTMLCNEMDGSFSMADLQDVAKKISNGNFDKDGTDKLKGKYKEAQERIRGNK